MLQTISDHRAAYVDGLGAAARQAIVDHRLRKKLFLLDGAAALLEIGCLTTSEK